MRRRLVWVLATALTGTTVLLGTGPAYAVPSNDDRASPVVVASVPTSFVADSSTATGGPTSLDRWYNTVWYSYTPSATGKVAVQATSISPSGWDNTLEVWNGSTQVTYNDDFYGLNAMLVFDATASTTYLIALGGYGSGSRGTATLRLSDLPPATPAAPTATAANSQAVVSWVAPSDNGIAITAYTIRAFSGSTLVSTTPGTGSPPTTSRTVTGLTNGTAYTFTVSATNLIGASSQSAASAATTPAGPPGVPTSVTAAAGDAEASVTWTAPASNGSAITAYTVRTYAGATLVSTDSVTGSPPLTSRTVTGLTNGTAYTFTVSATNLIGTSAQSAASAATTPARSPDVPTSVTATPGAAEASVSWTAPANNGAAISAYTVRAYSGSTLVSTTSVTGSPPATSRTVTGLTNGTAYTFTVSATNLMGTSSDSSPPASTTPVGLPGAPRSVTMAAGDGTLAVSWQPPLSDGGATVSAYTATLSPGGTTCSWAGVALSCSVSGLSNGTTYTATVRATNSVGQGAASTGSTGVPLPAAPSPTALTSSGTGTDVQQVTVTVPSGSTVRLLDGSTAAVSVSVAGEGDYALDTSTGVVTFTPAAGFAGAATAVTYRLTDAYGQHGTATYTPTVNAPAPAATPDPVVVVPAPDPVVTVAVATALTVTPRAGSVPVTCTTSAGTVTGCEVSLFAVVDGHRVLVGTGVGQDVVAVTLTELGRRLVARTGGRGLRAVASISVSGTTTVLTAEVAVTVVAQRVELRRAVRFGLDRAAVRDAARTFLRSLRGDLDGVRRVTCIGHTDSQGPASWNADLATDRARAVCAVVSKGLDVRSSVVSRGERAPVASNATAAGRAANRRVVVVLSY